MPKKPLRSPPARSPAPKRVRAARGGTPVFRAADVRAVLLDLAAQVAPADVTELMSREPALRARAAGLAAPRFALLRAQLELALDCLRDHLNGACPQIPYHTITLLAAAVSYFSDEMDLMPDFLPRLGQLDDAVVMAMACQLADAGLRRYCTWKGLAADVLLGAGGARRPR